MTWAKSVVLPRAKSQKHIVLGLPANRLVGCYSWDVDEGEAVRDLAALLAQPHRRAKVQRCTHT